jgi:hypothetical protein
MMSWYKEPGGPLLTLTAVQRISTSLRRRVVFLEAIQLMSLNEPIGGAKTSWGPWAQAIISLKWAVSTRFTMKRLLGP